MSEPAPFHADVADAPEGGRAFWLNTLDGLRLRAAVWDGGALGTAVVLPGRTEYIEKYGRVVRRLTERGLSVAVLDFRGQGLSTRNATAPHLGHVEDFRHYQHDVAALLAHLRDLDVHFGHQRARRVEHDKAAACRLAPDGLGHSMRAEDNRRAVGNLVQRLDEHRAPGPQLLDHVLVVDDLLAHVDGSAIELEGPLHRLHGAVDARAVAPRGGEQDGFRNRGRHRLRV